MQYTFILFIILALFVSFLVSYFQYYYRVINKNKHTPILFILKFLGFFLLVLLLFNPKIEKSQTVNIKPVLSFLVDGSMSIPFFKEEQNVSNFINEINSSKKLVNKFDIQQFVFGNNLKVLDSLSFNYPQTNISKPIVEVNNLFKNKIAPILLISDGNQTIGKDYEYINSKQPVYPIIIGDTSKYIDLKISQLNVNKYSYISNKFPVEVILNYEGEGEISTQFSILSGDKSIFKKNIVFPSGKKSVTINANLTSKKEGLHYYTAKITKLKKEKNVVNNVKNFSVEVIDEQTKVLILSSILHPDLGALKKAIESNSQRSVEIFNIDDFKNDIEDYQLTILYQPTNKFNKILKKIKSENLNYFLITGRNTDWNFINQQQIGLRKNAIKTTENFQAKYNEVFLTFLQEDLGFDNYPPLTDKFGEVSVFKEHQTLLYQKVNGIETKEPLLSSFDINNQKSAILLGEGIWKWRSSSFLNSNSFEDFDKFIGNLVQYLSSNKKRNRLEVNTESIYPANSTIKIAAFYTDKNYQFDERANLEIVIFNSDNKEILKQPFSLVKNSFQTEVENLSSGTYSYQVNVSNQKMSKKGKFKISTYNVEEQFTNANVTKLQKLADRTGGKLFYMSQKDEIIKELMEKESYYTIQKSSIKQQNLIDWQWIMFLAILLLSVEWFLRKFLGKI